MLNREHGAKAKSASATAARSSGPDRRAPQLFVAEDGEEEGTPRSAARAPLGRPAACSGERAGHAEAVDAARKRGRARQESAAEDARGGRRSWPPRPLAGLHRAPLAGAPLRPAHHGPTAGAAFRPAGHRREEDGASPAGAAKNGDGGRRRPAAQAEVGGRGRPRAQGTGKAGRPGASPVPWRLACLEEEERRKRRERRMTRGTH